MRPFTQLKSLSVDPKWKRRRRNDQARVEESGGYVGGGGGTEISGMWVPATLTSN